MSGQEEGRPHDSPETIENAFALAFPKGDESFPVLKAFQEFLDAERERARRRQMTLTICFMSAVVVLVVLFCVIGVVLFGGMMRRSDAQQAQMLDILLQRMPASVAQVQQAPAPQPAAQPVAAPPAAVAPQPDSQVSELLEVIKSLQAQNAEMMSALQKRIREPEPQAAPPDEQPSDETVVHEQRPGIFYPPRPETKPAPAKREPAPASGKAEPVAEKMAETTATPVTETATPQAGKTAPASATGKPESIAIERHRAPPEVPAPETKPGPVKIVRTRDMHAPAGYAPEQISIVSAGNVRFPWRVLMPTGTNTQEAAP